MTCFVGNGVIHQSAIGNSFDINGRSFEGEVGGVFDGPGDFKLLGSGNKAYQTKKCKEGFSHENRLLDWLKNVKIGAVHHIRRGKFENVALRRGFFKEKGFNLEA